MNVRPNGGEVFTCKLTDGGDWAARRYIMLRMAFEMRAVKADNSPGKANVLYFFRGSSPELLGVAANEVVRLEANRVEREDLGLCDTTRDMEGNGDANNTVVGDQQHH